MHDLKLPIALINKYAANVSALPSISGSNLPVMNESVSGK